MNMPFGKHKGLPVKELEIKYLQWLKTNVELKGDLLHHVNNALDGIAIPQKQKSDEDRIAEIIKGF